MCAQYVFPTPARYVQVFAFYITPIFMKPTEPNPPQTGTSSFQRTLPYLIIAVVLLIAGGLALTFDHGSSSTIPTATSTTSVVPSTTQTKPSGSAATEPTGTIAGLSSSVPAPRSTTQPVSPASNATISVGSTTYPVTIVAGETVDAAMHDLAASNSSFTFTEKNYPSLGEMIESINGLANADGTYWFLYINGKSSQTGASSTHLNPGDAVSWRYEKNTSY